MAVQVSTAGQTSTETMSDDESSYTESNFNCRLCFHFFESLTHLAYHYRTHLRCREFAIDVSLGTNAHIGCNACVGGFNDRRALESHLTSHKSVLSILRLQGLRPCLTSSMDEDSHAIVDDDHCHDSKNPGINTNCIKAEDTDDDCATVIYSQSGSETEDLVERNLPSDPGNGESSDPENGESSDPENGESLDPENGESSDSESGESSDSESGESSDSENEETTETMELAMKDAYEELYSTVPVDSISDMDDDYESNDGETLASEDMEKSHLPVIQTSVSVESNSVVSLKEQDKINKPQTKLCGKEYDKKMYDDALSMAYEDMAETNLDTNGESRHNARKNIWNFTCKECGIKFHNLKRFNKHFRGRSNCRNNIFKCELCPNINSDRLEWVNHCQSHFSLDECNEKPHGCMSSNYPCFICGLGFNQMSAYKLHIKRPVHYNHKKIKRRSMDVTSSTPKTLRCDVCQRDFENRIEWVDHCQSHFVGQQFGEKASTPKSLTYPCFVCGVNFQSYTSYVWHINTKKHQKLIEDFNGKETALGQDAEEDTIFIEESSTGSRQQTDNATLGVEQSAGNLEKQRKSKIVNKMTHNPVKRCMCLLCGVRYKYASQLTVHVRRSAHLHKGKYMACITCGKKFNCAQRLAIHITPHCKGNAYRGGPLKNTDASSILRKGQSAVNVKEPKKCVCLLCGFRCTYISRLQFHVQKARRVVHKGNYMACLSCGEKFKCFERLRQHITPQCKSVAKQKHQNQIKDYNGKETAFTGENAFLIEKPSITLETVNVTSKLGEDRSADNLEKQRKSKIVKRKTHGRLKDRCVCILCAYHCQYASQMTWHVRKSSRLHEGKYMACIGCGEKFNSSEKLGNHITSQCNEFSIVKKTTCGPISNTSDEDHLKTYESGLELGELNKTNDHGRKKHNTETDDQGKERSGKLEPINGVYFCGVCDKRYSMLRLFRDHLAEHVTEYSPTSNISNNRSVFLNEEIEKAPSSSLAFNPDDLIHENKKKLIKPDIADFFSCKFCEKIYSSFEKLEKHISSHL